MYFLSIGFDMCYFQIGGLVESLTILNVALSFQVLCIVITALLHFFLLLTFFMMLGVGTYFFMNVTVLFYAMHITNKFNSRSRLKWIAGSATCESIYPSKMVFTVCCVIMKTLAFGCFLNWFYQYVFFPRYTTDHCVDYAGKLLEYSIPFRSIVNI